MQFKGAMSLLPYGVIQPKKKMNSARYKERYSEQLLLLTTFQIACRFRDVKGPLIVP